MPLDRVTPADLGVSQSSQIAESRRKARERQKIRRYSGRVHLLFKDLTKIYSGKDALKTNAEAAIVIGNVVGSSLGPSGLDKMIVREIGAEPTTRHIIVTNDTAEVLGHVALEHPVAKLLADVAATVDHEIGDGTTRAVLLTCALVRAGYKLTQLGIHPLIVVDGFDDALRKALQICAKIASPLKKNQYSSAAKVSILGKCISVSEQLLADTAYRAVRMIARRTATGWQVNVKDIDVLKWAACPKIRLQLAEGVILKNVVATMVPKRIENARVATFSKTLTWRHLQSDYQRMLRFDLSTPEKFRQLREERLKFIRQRGEQIARSGANAVFCRKGMDEELIDYLGRRGVLAVRAVVDEDLARVSLATGAKVVTDVEQLSEETLGYAKLIEERKIGKTEWIFIDGCLAARNVSVLVLGPNDAIATDIEYTLRNAIAYTASLMQNPLVLFGGGAIEIELASRLRSWAPSISGKKQLAVLAFAEALEETPVFLARNAGMKSLDFLVKLRAQHAAGQISAGIDSVALRITDMRKLKVYDPLELVHQMLTSAAEAAAAILRTDYIMKVPRTQEEIIEKKKKERERRGKKPEDWVDEIPY